VRLSRHYPSVSEDIRLSVREQVEGFLEFPVMV